MKNPNEWRVAVRNAGRAMLKQMVLGEKKELRFLFKVVEGKDFNVALALIVHHLSVMIEQEEKLRSDQ